jgi:hypothetical protein
MAVLTFETIVLLANNTYDLTGITVDGVAVTAIAHTEELAFGASTVVVDDVSIDCDRTIKDTDYIGSALTAENDGGALTNIYLTWQNITARQIEELDLTGNDLTIKYSDNISEVYTLVP